MGNCLTCEYWGANAMVMGGNFERFQQSTGKCFCKGKNNPHYTNGDYMSAGDSCQYWKKHPQAR